MAARRFLPVLLMLVFAAAPALAANQPEYKILKGTWYCPVCESLHQLDTPENCEAKGHKHALKLTDGTEVTFVDDARAAELIKGGGRHSTAIEVCGLYNPKTHVMDVDAYMIDGKWSTWCDEHGRMDFCRGERDASPNPAKDTSPK